MCNSTHKKLDKILALQRQILSLLQNPPDFSAEDAAVLKETANVKAATSKVPPGKKVPPSPSGQ